MTALESGDPRASLGGASAASDPAGVRSTLLARADLGRLPSRRRTGCIGRRVLRGAGHGNVTASARFPFDVLDPTKLIPEEDRPIQVASRLVLDRNVDTFFLETERVAFCTQNVVPGIDFTDDPMLQGRNFSYLDTQLKRLCSPNFTHIPINAPKCPVMNFRQDGHMALRNPKGRVNDKPNQWNGPPDSREYPGPREAPTAGYRTFPQPADGPKLGQRQETFADHYSQGGNRSAKARRGLPAQSIWSLRSRPRRVRRTLSYRPSAAPHALARRPRRRRAPRPWRSCTAIRDRDDGRAVPR